MFTSPPLLPTSLTLAAPGLLLALVTTDSRPPPLRPSEQAWRSALMAAVDVQLPSDAKPCGVLPLVASAAERSRAAQCVDAAELDKEAFWVLSEAPGIDSRVWLLLIGASGKLQEWSLDSHGWEALGQPSFSSYPVPCAGYRQGQPFRYGELMLHEPAFVCVRA